MKEMGTTYIDELYRKKGEIQRQLCEIETEIREHIENEYKGKLQTAMELLSEIYVNIPNSRIAHIETECLECDSLVRIDLDDTLGKIEYVFNRLIKEG